MISAGKDFFYHGWTRINTDRAEEPCRQSVPAIPLALLWQNYFRKHLRIARRRATQHLRGQMLPGIFGQHLAKKFRRKFAGKRAGKFAGARPEFFSERETGISKLFGYRGFRKFGPPRGTPASGPAFVAGMTEPGRRPALRPYMRRGAYRLCDLRRFDFAGG